MEAYTEALKFARAGNFVFSVARGQEQWSLEIANATNDVEYLERFSSRTANFYLRTSGPDILYGFRIGKAHQTDPTQMRDLRILYRDTGLRDLPLTPTIELTDSGVVYLLFARHESDPQFLYGKDWQGASVHLAKAVPLPGSVHASGRPYKWRIPPTQAPYARLPSEFVPHLPQRALPPDSILSNVVDRGTFDPKAVARWDDGPVMRYARGNAHDYESDYD